MSNILYITNLGGKRMSYAFSGTAIEAAHSLGHEFYSVANRSNSSVAEIREDEEKYGIRLLHIDLVRSPFSFQNIKAYKQLCRIISENKIDYIHCNTPVGGILGRLAGKKCGVKNVIYQVHGFHFYKGAPKLNWILYYTIEKWLSRFTDALITINKEDYAFASKKLKFRNNGKIYYVPGVGIDRTPYQFENADKIRAEKREELGLSQDDFVLISVGRLDKNKNNKTLIEAVHMCQNQNIHLVVCGDGEERDMLYGLAKKLGIDKNIHFLGNRSDMAELYQTADAYVMASFREGLSRSIMEAMSSGLPCVVSKIRGNVDLVMENDGGYLYSPYDADGFADGMKKLYNSPELKENMKKYNLEKIKNFDISVVEKQMTDIYKEVF